MISRFLKAFLLLFGLPIVLFLSSCNSAQSVTPALTATANTTCKIPNLIGLSQEESETKLIKLGLRPIISTEPHDSIASGIVTSQEPAAGAELDPCEGNVIVAISSGPAPTATNTSIPATLPPTSTPTSSPTDTPVPSATPDEETAPPTETNEPVTALADSCEPNDALATACDIKIGQTYNLNFVPSEAEQDDVDFFRLSIVEGLQYSCETFSLSEGTDTFIRLTDRQGTVFSENDDTESGLNSSASYLSTYNGSLYVEVFSFTPIEYEESPLYTYKLECFSTTPATATPTPTKTRVRVFPTSTPFVVTATPDPSVTPATPTITPTNTPSASGPLAFTYSLSWAVDPDDPIHAIATVVIVATGGTGEYTYYHDDIPQSGATFTYRWVICKEKPGSFRVDSGGESVRVDYYEFSPCPSTPTPAP